MNQLVCCLGNDSGKAHVEKLINAFEWDDILFITMDNTQIKCSKKHMTINVDSKKTSEQISEDLTRNFKKDLRGIDVGVNFFSGPGKLHMAVISALIKNGLGIRLVVMTPEGLKEI